MNLSDLSPQDFDALTRDHARRHALSRRGFMGAGLSLAVLAGIGLPGTAAFAAGGSGVLRVGRAEEPDTLDPHKTSLSVSSDTMDLILEPMARRDADGNVGPGLAESWEFSNGNRTLTFKLKPGVMFHDGTPCDAAAVAWTVERHMAPETASVSTFFIGPLERVEVIDPQTIAYHYKEPFVPVWVGMCLGYTAPISRAAVEAKGDQFGRAPVGAGPFKFVSWSPDRGMRLERNENYGPVAMPPPPGAVEVIHYPEDTTRLAAFDTGEINAIYHGASVPVDAIRRLRNNPDVTLMERPAQMMRAIVFNISKAPFDNPLVRKAVAHAIDAESMIAFAMDGNAVVATSNIASSLSGYNPATKDMGYAYDPEKAKALLAEAGHASGLSVSLITNDTAAIRRAAEIIQAQLGEVGIEVKVQSMPIAQWVPETLRGEQDMVISTYTYSDADVVYTTLHSTGALNRLFHKDADLDAWVSEQRATSDEAARQAILDKIQEYVLTEALWKPLFEPLNFAIVAAEVENAELTTGGQLLPQHISIKS